MDFLRALEVAEQKGLTKDEFIDIWKTELHMKQQENAQTSQGTVYGNLHQNNSDSQLSASDQSQHCFMQDGQKYEELKQYLYVNFHYLHDQLMEKQERHWQQMQLKWDQMMEQFKCHFEILSNLTDSNSNSVKIHFMHELEVLKQDLGKMIKEHSVNSLSGPMISEMSTQHIELPVAQDTRIQKSIPSFGMPNNATKVGINHKDEEKQHDNLSLSSQPSLHSLHQLHQQDMSDTGFERQIQNHENTEFLVNGQVAISVDTKNATEIAQHVKFKSYANVVTSSPKVEAHVAGASEAGRFNAVLGVTSLFRSIEATGSYPEAIANQMKHTQSSRANSLGSDSRPLKSGSLKSKSKTKTVKSENMLVAGPNQQVFTIHNSDQFSISNKLFMSEFMYSSGHKCRVRVRLNFEKTGALNVLMHISKGVYDDSYNWPLLFSGVGYIWNKTSRGRTQIWQLRSVSCQKPHSSDGEYIPAIVCLSTSRDTCPNVKYKKLVDKHYADDNVITFIWDLHAEEDHQVLNL